MIVTEMSRVVAVTLVPMLGAFFARFLIVDWKYPRHTITICFWAIQALHFISAAWLIIDFGPTASVRLFLGTVPILVYNIAFFFLALSGYRDGRAMFSIISVQLLSCVGCALSTVIFPYGSPFWSLCWAAFVLVMCVIFHLFCRERIRFMLHSIDSGWRQMSILPISLLLCLYVLFVYPVLNARWDLFSGMAVTIICFITFMIYIAIYLFLRFAHDQYEAKRNSDFLRFQMGELRSRAEHLAAINRENSLYRHDQRHNILLLDTFLQDGNVAEARRILDHLSSKLDHMSRLSSAQKYTGLPIIDAAIQLTAQRAQSIGAQFTVQLQPSFHHPTDYNETALAIFNALENAVHACENVPQGQERFIRIIGVDRPEQYLLSVSNSYAGKIRLDAETGLPIAQEKGHGYGTQSIADFAAKHNSILKYTVEDNICTMHLLFRKELFHTDQDEQTFPQPDQRELLP